MDNQNDFKWKQKYSLKIPELDKQHKEIIALVRDLSRLCAIDDKESYETFKIMLFSAAQYFRYHFFEEELLMQEKCYPEYPEHKEKHDKMLQKLNEMINNIGKDEKINIKIITDYLRGWFTEHFVTSDKLIGE